MVEVVVVPLAPLMLLGLDGLGAGLEAEVVPLVAVALEAVVVAPLKRLFKTGLLLLFPSNRLLMAALFNRSSSLYQRFQ